MPQLSQKKKKKRNPHAENESFFIVQQTTSRKVETYHFFRHKRNDCLLKDSKTTGHKQKKFQIRRFNWHQLQHFLSQAWADDVYEHRVQCLGSKQNPKEP